MIAELIILNFTSYNYCHKWTAMDKSRVQFSDLVYPLTEVVQFYNITFAKF